MKDQNQPKETKVLMDILTLGDRQVERVKSPEQRMSYNVLENVVAG